MVVGAAVVLVPSAQTRALEILGQVGVLGPVRLDYPEVVPTVRYYGNLIEELLGVR